MSEDYAKIPEIKQLLSVPNDEISVWLASINRRFVQYRSVFAGLDIHKTDDLERIRDESELENEIGENEHRKEIMAAIEKVRSLSVLFLSEFL